MCECRHSVCPAPRTQASTLSDAASVPARCHARCRRGSNYGVPLRERESWASVVPLPSNGWRPAASKFTRDCTSSTQAARLRSRDLPVVGAPPCCSRLHSSDIHCSGYSSVGGLGGWAAWWLAGRMAGWQAGRPAGGRAEWLASWLVGSSTGWRWWDM